MDELSSCIYVPYCTILPYFQMYIHKKCVIKTFGKVCLISFIEVHSFSLTKSWPSIQRPNTIWNGKRNYSIRRGDLISGCVTSEILNKMCEF